MIKTVVLISFSEYIMLDLKMFDFNLNQVKILLPLNYGVKIARKV